MQLQLAKTFSLSWNSPLHLTPASSEWSVGQSRDPPSNVGQSRIVVSLPVHVRSRCRMAVLVDGAGNTPPFTATTSDRRTRGTGDGDGKKWSKHFRDNDHFKDSAVLVAWQKLYYTHSDVVIVVKVEMPTFYASSACQWQRKVWLILNKVWYVIKSCEKKWKCLLQYIYQFPNKRDCLDSLLPM